MVLATEIVDWRRFERPSQLAWLPWGLSQEKAEWAITSH